MWEEVEAILLHPAALSQEWIDRWCRVTPE